MEYLLIAFSFITLLLLSLQFFKKSTDNFSSIENIFKTLIQNEFVLNREELSKNLKENRTELIQAIERLNETLSKKAKDDREELRNTLKDFEEAFSKNVESFNKLQKEKFDQMSAAETVQSETMDESLTDKLRSAGMIQDKTSAKQVLARIKAGQG